MTPKLKRNPPFRAEQLGSLLRPQNLLEARKMVEEGQMSAEELRKVEDEAIREIVNVQINLGYHAISDGEYRRHMFWGTFFRGLQGMITIKEPPFDLFRSYVPDIAPFLESEIKLGETMLCVGKIKHVGSTYLDQWNYLKFLVPSDKVKDLKLTLAAPEWYHLRYRNGKAYPKSVYGSDEEYFADIAEAYRTELGILYDAGLRNVQIDDPNFAYFCSKKMISGWKADAENTQTIDEQLDAYIKLYNDCISKAPPDMLIGVHVCRGNFANSRHFSEGGYDRIATKLFKDLNVSTYYLEYDTPRAGGFEPLGQLPLNKTVILGVVTSKFAKLENLEEVKARVMQAAQVVAKGHGVSTEEALDSLGVSPQCGFASHSSGNAIDHEGMVNKLKLVRRVADEIWHGEP